MTTIPKFFVKLAGTVGCRVMFRMTQLQKQKVKQFYGKNPDAQIVFRTGEIYSKGYGWYEAHGDDDHVDGALRVLNNIKHALKHFVEAMTKRTKKALDAAIECSRIMQVYKKVKRIFVPVKAVKVNGRTKLVAKNRAVQAAFNRDQEITAEIARLAMLPFAPKLIPITPSLVQQLNSRFGH